MGKQTRGKMFILAAIVVIVGCFLPFKRYNLGAGLFTKGSSIFDLSQPNQIGQILGFSPTSQIIQGIMHGGAPSVIVTAVLFLILGSVLAFVKIPSVALTTSIKVGGNILHYIQIGGFLNAAFLAFIDSPASYGTSSGYLFLQPAPDVGFFVVALGVGIGALAFIIPDKKEESDSGNGEAKAETKVAAKTQVTTS